MGEEFALLGLRVEVQNQQVLFYVDDGLLASRDPVWLQTSFNLLVQLFECVGLKTNAKKTMVMVCCPGPITCGFMEESYTASRAGGNTVHKRK